MAKKKKHLPMVPGSGNMPEIFKNIPLADAVQTDGLETYAYVKKNDGKIIQTASYVIKDGIPLAMATFIPNTKYKKDRLPAMRYMKEKKIPQKEIARIFDISESYASKLLKEE